MIQSAQVFTPRPSKDPRENLRVLQSPLKNAFKSPSKPSSLSRPPLNAPEEEEEIVLVDGDHPRVVEEGRDLVILEDVEVQSPAPPVPPQYQAPPQTPQRKRSLSRNTLHRAVLIRSAQRAVLRAEKEREEEEEEMEVLGAVAANVEESDEEADQGGEEEYTDEDEDEDGKQESEQQTTEQKSLWRKSLERIWLFGSSSGAEEEVDVSHCIPSVSPKLMVDLKDDGVESNSDSDSETDHTPTNEIPQNDEQDDNEMEEEENLGPLPTVPMQTPARRVLGSFMTPQARGPTRTTLFPHLSDTGQAPPPQLAPGGSVGRHSLGGIEAKRVPLPQTWRVKDIVVPINPAPPSTPQGVRRGTGFSLQQTTPRAAGFSGRQTLTEEERKAIQERRRSALREADTFFAGGVPGMSPSKPAPASSSSSGSAASNSASSVKLASNLFAVRSPVKPGQAVDRCESAGDDEDELDTRSLLERMKETVEGMKRRRSMAPGVGLDTTPRPGKECSTPREVPSTPLPAFFAAAVGPVRSEPEDTEKDPVEDKELELVKDVPFSLLAPGAREELLTRRQSVVVLDHASTVPVVIHAASDDDMNVDEPSTEKTTTTKERPKARLLRSKKSAAEPEEAEMPIEEQESAKLNVVRIQPSALLLKCLSLTYFRSLKRKLELALDEVPLPAYRPHNLNLKLMSENLVFLNPSPRCLLLVGPGRVLQIPKRPQLLLPWSPREGLPGKPPLNQRRPLLPLHDAVARLSLNLNLRRYRRRKPLLGEVGSPLQLSSRRMRMKTQLFLHRLQLNGVPGRVLRPLLRN